VVDHELGLRGGPQRTAKVLQPLDQDMVDAVLRSKPAMTL
jgi:hypothetical protein